jgi:hypothetical protein
MKAARPQGRKRLAQIYKKESRPQAAIFFEKHKGRTRTWSALVGPGSHKIKCFIPGFFDTLMQRKQRNI